MCQSVYFYTKQVDTLQARSPSARKELLRVLACTSLTVLNARIKYPLLAADFWWHWVYFAIAQAQRKFGNLSKSTVGGKRLYHFATLPLSVKTYFLGNKRECETVKKPIAPRIPQTRSAATSVLPAAVATVAELVVEVLPDVANFCLNDSHLLPPFVLLLLE
jgi:hypothetical protein